jgi:hypothetical protein
LTTTLTVAFQALDATPHSRTVRFGSKMFKFEFGSVRRFSKMHTSNIRPVILLAFVMLLSLLPCEGTARLGGGGQLASPDRWL